MEGLVGVERERNFACFEGVEDLIGDDSCCPYVYFLIVSILGINFGRLMAYGS